MPAISAPAKVLITGASGFIAIHVVKAFLAEGFRVRGTVRSAPRGEFLSSLFNSDKFEFVVADIEKQEQLEAAIAGVDGIAHIASPVGAAEGADPQDVIRPAVDGTLNVLKAAQKVGGVQRIVVTGSILNVFQPHEPPYTYTTKDWNEAVITLITEKGASADGFSKYSASKVLAEREANKWIAENKPSFDIAHVLPTFVYGPVLGNIKTLDDVALTPKRLLGFFANDVGDVLGSAGPFIHVDDVARAQVAVISRTALGGGRRHIIASPHDTTFQEYFDAYWSIPEAERPKLPFEVPKGKLGTGLSVRAQRNKFETAEAELGWKFKPLDVVVKDTLTSISTRVFGL